jgi:aflatoxin B1 aldehyde reductase
MAEGCKLIIGTNNFTVSGDSGTRGGSVIDDVDGALAELAAIGVTEIDCARAYSGGKSEEALGVAGYGGFVLASKTMWASLGYDQVMANMEATLAALQTEQLDIYYLHSPDPSESLTSTLRAVHELHQAGKFVELGVSNFTSWQVMQIREIMISNSWGPLPTVYEGAYSVVQRDVERELIPMCHELGMRFYAYSPLARGVLTGKFATPDDDSINRLQQRYMSPAMHAALSALNDVCVAEGVDLKDAALRWLVHHSALSREHDDGVILGGSSLAQMKENVMGASGGPLPDVLLAALDEAEGVLHPVPSFPAHGVMKL